MPGLEAAIGAHPYLYLVAERIARREFDAGDAMALIRYSDLSRGYTGGHPGPHVSVTSPARSRDFHLAGTTYAARARHTMFRSEQEAAGAVAAALNTQAGAEAVLRLQHLRLGKRAVLYSRSGARIGGGVNRAAGSHGVTWTAGATEFVTLVLEHSGDGQLVLITAYPNLASAGDHRVVPPDGADLLEMPRGRFAVFWHSR
ncbi:MAG TPA: hypothetical protein VMU80_07450 [Bryobacteraceae bacterium]|nr:hypothetical protein [Bryobacteraceae bacterium]